MQGSFVLRSKERGYTEMKSTGPTSSYVAGHPDARLTRHSSFNFNDYQSGRPGFGKVRVFGDEVFSGAGCGYNMHPHHDFVICAFVLQGQLTHVNTVGNLDQLSRGDFYVFSAGSGGKHSELNLRAENMNAIYIWFLPDQLYLPPTYHRAHFDAQSGRNQLVTLVGDAEGALPIPQDVRVLRFAGNLPSQKTYRLSSTRHGVYAFVIDGQATFNGTSLGKRDSAAVWGAETVEFSVGSESSDILFVETIM
jgi:quercetin 2,3-dioxygenase